MLLCGVGVLPLFVVGISVAALPAAATIVAASTALIIVGAPPLATALVISVIAFASVVLLLA